MDKKKLLIYAHYYAPDVASTGQILQELAEGMKDAFDITVICVVPSYTGKIEDKYKAKRFYIENLNGIRLIRIRVPEFSKSNKKSRIKNILAYYYGAKAATRKLEHFDYVFSISQPPILGGMLGVYGKKIKKAKFIYNIQDFNPEQIMAVNYVSNPFILKMVMALDKRSCRKSDLIITVGRDLVETVKKRFLNEKVPNTVLINNWIDEKSIYPLPESNTKVQEFKKRYGLSDKFVIMYSGNIGLYYDLPNLIKVIEKFKNAKSYDGRDVAFAFVGDGSKKAELQKYAEENNMNNVCFIPYQPKEELIYSLNAADVHWCVSAAGIKGVSCPSKAYGIMAVGKPILGIMEKGSEIRCIVEEANGGICCEPGQYDIVEKNMQWALDNAGRDTLRAMGISAHKYLVKKLSKTVSDNKYKKAIMDT